MLKVKLKKIESTHNNLRTDEIEGHTTHIPEVGHGFVLFAPPLEYGNMRTVFTTPAKEVSWVETDRKFLFQTQNSKYELTVIDDKDPMEYRRYEPKKEKQKHEKDSST